MSFTIEILTKYLGNPVSVMLSDQLFKQWKFKRAVYKDIIALPSTYASSKNWLDLLCDGDERVKTIILHSTFGEDLLDVQFSLTRQQVLQQFGLPEKSGDKWRHPILGELGPWDRFSRPGYLLHFRYRLTDQIELITLMTPDVVP